MTPRAVCGPEALCLPTPPGFTVAKLQLDKQWIQAALEVEPLPRAPAHLLLLHN